MPGALNITPNRTGTLLIDGNTTHTVGWEMLNLLPLWLPGATRGDNLVIPGAVGRRPKRKRVDEAAHSLPMAFEGYFSGVDESPFDDPWAGLEQNIADFVERFVDQPAPPAKVRAAALQMPSGGSRTADIQVIGLTIGQNTRTQCRATLDIVIPSGRFA